MQSYRNPVSLHCVFHSIRFKVNKGWSKALLLFYVYTSPSMKNIKLERHNVPLLKHKLRRIADID
ncbi:hypothetical protein DW055_11300 [Bacteroides ovatus]|nr:hypothetical protein DW055_11300 [Bacteroides ovatus]